MSAPGILTFDGDAGRAKVTHHLFRFPAKFHPPVVAELLSRYTQSGDIVLDPFVGSGTLLVEAALQGRQGYGVDVDPLAIFVAQAKSRLYDVESARAAISTLLREALTFDRGAEAYQELMRSDISDAELEETIDVEQLKIPSIPNLRHWFRSYVIVDLARIRKIIAEIPADARTKLLLTVIFASIIRNSSNADPVPVSGLEYTAHMRRRDAAGREVNPHALLKQTASKAMKAVEDWQAALPRSAVEPQAYRASALSLPGELPSSIDAVITSPPYHNAVDYYRRHQLEMFWLGMTNSQQERLSLLPNYIGRPGVALTNPLFKEQWNPSPLADEWERKIRAYSEKRANDFRHYVIAMGIVFRELARHLRSQAPAVFVLGHSQWNGQQIPTDLLFAEVALPYFHMQEVLTYPVKNRYMSYSRHNSANIDQEYVLVLRRQ